MITSITIRKMFYIHFILFFTNAHALLPDNYSEVKFKIETYGDINAKSSDKRICFIAQNQKGYNISGTGFNRIANWLKSNITQSSSCNKCEVEQLQKMSNGARIELDMPICFYFKNECNNMWWADANECVKSFNQKAFISKTVLWDAVDLMSYKPAATCNYVDSQNGGLGAYISSVDSRTKTVELSIRTQGCVKHEGGYFQLVENKFPSFCEVERSSLFVNDTVVIKATCDIRKMAKDKGVSCVNNNATLPSLGALQYGDNDQLCREIQLAKSGGTTSPNLKPSTGTTLTSCGAGMILQGDGCIPVGPTQDQANGAGDVTNNSADDNTVTATGAAPTPGESSPANQNTELITRCQQTIGYDGYICNSVTGPQLTELAQACSDVGIRDVTKCFNDFCRNQNVGSISSCITKVNQKYEEQKVANSYISPPIEQCTQREDEATECCENPLKCSFGIDMLGEASASQLDRLIVQTIGQATVGAGQTAQCKFIKNANIVMASMHTTMASKCGNKINSCKRTCDTMITQVRQQMNQMNCASSGYGTSSRTMSVAAANTSGAGCSQAQEDLIKLEGANNTCEDELSSKLGQLGMQLAQNVADMSAASSCEGESKQANTPTDAFDPNSLMPNCSDPANVSNPLCASGGFNSASSATGLKSSASASGGFDSSANLGALSQDGLAQGNTIQEVDITKTETNALGSGGSGGNPLGGSGSSGGGYAGGSSSGGAGSSSGLNTNIGKASARNGYTQSAGGGFGGGGGGSSSSAKKRGSSDDSFDFKKMLGMLNKGKSSGSRSIAGFGATKKAKDVDTAYTDIFKKISDAWFKQCETNGFDDCKQNMRNEN